MADTQPSPIPQQAAPAQSAAQEDEGIAASVPGAAPVAPSYLSGILSAVLPAYLSPAGADTPAQAPALSPPTTPTPSPPTTPTPTRRSFVEITIETVDEVVGEVVAPVVVAPPVAPAAEEAPPPYEPPSPTPVATPVAAQAVSPAVVRAATLPPLPPYADGQAEATPEKAPPSPPLAPPLPDTTSNVVAPPHSPQRRNRMQQMLNLMPRRRNSRAQRSLIVVDPKDLHCPKTAGKPTNEALAFVTMVIDRSGSMQAMGTEVAGGVNAYLDEQRKTDAATGISTHVLLTIFDNKYEVVRSAPLSEHPTVTDEDVKPRGMTAMFDAIGSAIGDTVRKLDEMKERPSSVTVFILTDGEENASHRWHSGMVKAQIKALEAQPHEWEFYFAAANQDAITSGASNLGLNKSECLSFGASPAGFRTSMENASKSLSRMKRTPHTIGHSRKSERFGSREFSSKERASSMTGNFDVDDLM